MEEGPDGKAIPFIVNKDGEFVVAEEAEEFLKSLSGRKLGVVCIVGKYRTGKSYLINKVVLQRGCTEGFKVGPTVNPCTKGLWIWNKTVKGTSSDGEEIDMVVMDCEGFGGMDESQNHDTRIFLFALLLSSCFVYNSVGSIDENALQTLSLVVNLAKDIKMRAEDKGPISDEELAENFPSFLWVVRDFTLRMVDNNDNPLTSKQYLESALANVKGCSEAVENKNKVRRLLKHFFRERDCVTMVRPVELEQDLQNLQTLPDKYIREEFLQQAQVVRNKIVKKTKPKHIHGMAMEGETLLHLANGYAVAVNRGKVPTIESAWSYVCKEKANEAAKECLASLDSYIKSEEIQSLMSEDKDWKGEVVRKMIKKFLETKIEDTRDLKDRQAQLEREITDRLEILSRSMNHQHTEVCQKWLEKHFSNVAEIVRENEISTPQQVEEYLRNLATRYEEQNKNMPARLRDKIFKQFSSEKEAKMLDMVIRAREEEQKKEKEQQARKLEAIEKEAAEKRIKFEEDRDKMAFRIRELEDMVVNHKAQEAGLQERVSHLQNKLEAEKQCAAEAKEAAKKEKEEMAKQFQTDLESANKMAMEKDKELIKSKSEQEKSEMMLHQQKALSNDAIENLKRRIHDLEGNIAASKAREDELRVQVKELQKNEEAKQLKAQLDTAREKRRSLENELSEVKNEKQFLDNQIDFYKNQLEDNKKVQETLLGALQQQLKVDEDNTATELLTTNKNLGTSLGKAEARIKTLEEKANRYKLYKQMVAGAKAFICKETGKTIPKNAFLAHLQHLAQIGNQGEKDSQDSVSRMPEQYVQIQQTMIKECPDTGKAYTEYLLKINFGRGLWSISRTYREFCELNHMLVQAFPNLKMPSAANQIIGFSANVSSSINPKRRTVLEERRAALEEYINDLMRIPQVMSSQVFKDFLKIDLYCDQNVIQQLENPGRALSQIDQAETTSLHKAKSLLLDSGRKQYSTTHTDFRRPMKENHQLINFAK